jgi:hypothetical protein
MITLKDIKIARWQDGKMAMKSDNARLELQAARIALCIQEEKA